MVTELPEIDAPSFGELIDTDGRSSGSTAVAVAGRLAAGPVAEALAVARADDVAGGGSPPLHDVRLARQSTRAAIVRRIPPR